MTDAAVSVVDTYVWSLLPGVRGTDSEAELPDHVAVRFFVFRGPASPVFTAGTAFPPGAPLLPVLLAVTLFFCLAVVCLSMAAVLAVRPLVRSPAHPSVCEVVSLCGLELHFPNI